MCVNLKNRLNIEEKQTEMSKNVDQYEATRALVQRLDGTIALSQISTAESIPSKKKVKILDEETYTKVLRSQ